MEDFKKKNAMDLNDKEIVFSKSIKAGKRIYYLDVKKNRKDEMFLAITESKKIFLYQEDFEKFMTGLTQAIAFINKKQPLALDDSDKKEKLEVDLEENLGKTEIGTEIKFDIDFE